MATLQTIYEQIKLLNTVYQRGISDPSMRAMAIVWETDLEELSDHEFIAAISEHRKTSRYWPTPADILDAQKTAIPNRPPVLALEERPVTREDMQKFSLSASMVLASLSGSPRAKEYFETEDPEEKEAIAAEVLGARYVAGESSRQGGPKRFMQ